MTALTMSRRSAIALLLNATVLCSPALAAPGAHGPNGEHLDGAVAAPTSGLARLTDGSVNIPMLAQRRLALRTRVIVESDAATTVELAGRIVVDPNAGGRIQSVHGGRLEAPPRGLPVPGQTVRRGDILAFVRHHAEPYAAAAQRSQLAELRSARQIAEERLRRLQALEGSVPRKDLEAARLELQSLKVRENAIGTSLVARETLVSPVSGVVSRVDATLGQIVDAREVLFEVVDPNRVLVEATTSDPALARTIHTATLKELPALQLQLLGVAGSLRDGVLPMTFRGRADPKAGVPALAVGQPVTVIATQKKRTKGFAVPAQAVVRNAANETVVWIKSGAERYIPQPVRYQVLDAGHVLITSGLGADNRVVVEGAALIAQIR